MSNVAAERAALDASIDVIEAGYEYLLAYAAQGRQSDQGPGSGMGVRPHLGQMAEALAGLGEQARACAKADPAIPEQAQAFFDAVDADAGVALGAIRLVLAQTDISSQLIDNLNASIHLRAVLTDLFLLDETLKSAPD